MIGNFICLIVLLMFNAYFSTIEAAFYAVNRGKMKLLAESGNKKAFHLLKHMESISKISAALRFVIVLTALFIGVLASHFFINEWKNLFSVKTLWGNEKIYQLISFIVTTLICTYFVSVFGEMAPKRIGIKYADSIALKSIIPSKILLIITMPFSAICRISANSIVRAMGIDPNEIDSNITEEEIRMMIDAGGDSGSIDASEQEMINNIFELDNTSVGDIATHRTDIIAIPLDAALDEIVQVINEEKFSRIPVYDDNIDNIIGIFHVKDMAKYILNHQNAPILEDFHIDSILMQPYFVPFSKKTDELFKEMQRKKVHMAIVIDEYGGTAGIVTMEDIIEEIVGNIFDEYDMEEEEDIRCVNENTFLINGTTDLSDVEDLLNVTFEDDEDYDTLSGYLIGQLGRIPDIADRPVITINNINFHVEKMEEKRIDTVRVIIYPKIKQDTESSDETNT